MFTATYALHFLQQFLKYSSLFRINFSVADFMCCDVERLARMISVPVEVWNLPCKKLVPLPDSAWEKPTARREYEIMKSYCIKDNMPILIY